MTPFTVGGGLLGLTALCGVWRPCGKQFWWHSYFPQLCGLARTCQLAVKVFIPCLMSDRALIRSRHHPSIYHRRRSILLSLSPSACQIPALSKSPARSLLAPRCFSLLAPLKFEGRSRVNTPFAHFCGCFGGQHIVGPGSHGRQRLGRE